jgi:hypothetical protein
LRSRNIEFCGWEFRAVNSFAAHPENRQRAANS